MTIIPYSENNTDILQSDEPKLACISFDAKTAVVGLLDEAVEHHILLLKVGLNPTDIDKYYRIIFDRESADWTFVCPSDYKNIMFKDRRIKAFYNDDFAAIAQFLSQIDYFSDINIPKRYRRHLQMLDDNTLI